MDENLVNAGSCRADSAARAPLIPKKEIGCGNRFAFVSRMEDFVERLGEKARFENLVDRPCGIAIRVGATIAAQDEYRDAPGPRATRSEEGGDPGRGLPLPGRPALPGRSPASVACVFRSLGCRFRFGAVLFRLMGLQRAQGRVLCRRAIQRFPRNLLARRSEFAARACIIFAMSASTFHATD